MKFCATFIYYEVRAKPIYRNGYRDLYTHLWELGTAFACYDAHMYETLVRIRICNARSNEKTGSHEKFGSLGSRTIVQLPRIQHLHNVYKPIARRRNRHNAAQCRHPHTDGLTATEVITDAFQGAPTEYRNYADGVIIFATRLLGSILN